MASDGLRNVLFLCTHNSARSILAEVYLNQAGSGRFRAFSAGSHPSGQVNPHALAMLAENRLPTDGLRSKDWSEFTRPGAPELDFVITVCDSARGEVCPVWPGQPITAHWGVEDPSAVAGSDEDKRRAFRVAYMVLQRRIDLMLALPLERLDRLKLQERMDQIGTQR